MASQTMLAEMTVSTTGTPNFHGMMEYNLACKGYSIWDPEGGGLENFADPLPYSFFQDPHKGPLLHILIFVSNLPRP